MIGRMAGGMAGTLRGLIFRRTVRLERPVVVLVPIFAPVLVGVWFGGL